MLVIEFDRWTFLHLDRRPEYTLWLNTGRGGVNRAPVWTKVDRRWVLRVGPLKIMRFRAAAKR